MKSEIDGVKHSLPLFLYGTAWKEDNTQLLTEMAIDKGFRGVDTANQRRHYVEAAVGNAVKKKCDDGVISRKDLFLQTKFTFLPGQDNRLPYDREAPISTQVKQSFQRSLEHLQTDYIDSYVLHGPSYQYGLSEYDWEAWQTMENLQKKGQTRFLGISNVTLEQVEMLWTEADVKPDFVQNRCFAHHGWDYHVRRFCREKGLIYQGFSLLTANRFVFEEPEIEKLASKYSKTKAQIIFRFALEVGMLPLTGTSDPEHMKIDLECASFSLEKEEIRTIEAIGLKE